MHNVHQELEGQVLPMVDSDQPVVLVDCFYPGALKVEQNVWDTNPAGCVAHQLVVVAMSARISVPIAASA